MAQTFTMEDLKARLQARQHKMTPQRQTVLQIFLDHPGEHLSAEDVHGILRDRKVSSGFIFKDSYDESPAPEGGTVYTVNGLRQPTAGEGTDLRAVMDGYISVGKARNIS